MRYENLYFAQESEAEPMMEFDAAEVVNMISGLDGPIEDTNPAGSGDHLVTVWSHGERFQVSYNFGIPYVGVCRLIEEA